jgi:acyl-CoA synthetase (NDP forming)
MACEELRPYLGRELGWPLNELGRIRLHKADIAGAEEALLAAHRAGWDPQPGLALVRLAQGDAATAVGSIRDALERPLRVPSKERPPNTDLQRAPLLEAQVEVEIAAGDIARAVRRRRGARGTVLVRGGATLERSRPASSIIDPVDRPFNEPSREVDSAQQRLKRRPIVGG